MPNDDALSDLRRQIDSIDDALLGLLNQRGELARRVADAKGPGAPLRAAREAQILRRLETSRNGPFPALAVARIWREIISAMNSLQGGLSVAVCLPDGDAAYWDLARDHFGVICPITPHAQPTSVIRAVAEFAGAVGVVPLPRADERDPWWRHLVRQDDKTPRIIGRLPFIAASSGQDALVIGRCPVEPSGLDRSFIALEAVTETSRARLLSRLSAAELEVTFVTSEPDAAPQGRWFLVEVQGFVASQDPRLQRLRDAAPDEFGQLVVLGAYPTPMGLESHSGGA